MITNMRKTNVYTCEFALEDRSKTARVHCVVCVFFSEFVETRAACFHEFVEKRAACFPEFMETRAACFPEFVEKRARLFISEYSTKCIDVYPNALFHLGMFY